MDYKNFQNTRINEPVYREYLESFASKFNCYLESGEGDPCDLYLVREKIDTKSN